MSLRFFTRSFSCGFKPVWVLKISAISFPSYHHFSHVNWLFEMCAVSVGPISARQWCRSNCELPV